MYGVGKWTHIKKLLFSSSSHRTSVNLKVFHVQHIMHLCLIFLSNALNDAWVSGQMEKSFEGVQQ